eukprot:936945-Rhodomonas_salina.1
MAGPEPRCTAARRKKRKEKKPAFSVQSAPDFWLGQLGVPWYPFVCDVRRPKGRTACGDDGLDDVDGDHLAT